MASLQDVAGALYLKIARLEERVRALEETMQAKKTTKATKTKKEKGQ
jgi:hypothetical protein